MIYWFNCRLFVTQSDRRLKKAQSLQVPVIWLQKANLYKLGEESIWNTDNNSMIEIEQKKKTNILNGPYQISS